MKTLEVRRHSMRKTGSGSQLSQEGVADGAADQQEDVYILAGIWA